MLNKVKSICTNTGYFAYYSAFAAYEVGAASLGFLATTAYATAATGYTVKGLAKTAYYSAIHLPSFGSALSQYPTAVSDYLVHDDSEAWEEADEIYEEATKQARVDFSETANTFTAEINSVSTPLVSNFNTAISHTAKSFSYAYQATGHALKVADEALALGSEILEKASDVILGETTEKPASQVNNKASFFSQPHKPQQEQAAARPILQMVV